MTLPNTASLGTYGSALNDYGIGVIDPTTDKPASGGNNESNDVAMMTATAVRAWVKLTWQGTGTPTVSAHNALWGNAIAVTPTLARTTTGIGTITWPVNVNDFIPSGSPGYNGPIALNLRAGWGAVRGATLYYFRVDVTSANVATVYVYNSAGAAADPTGVAFDAFVI